MITITKRPTDHDFSCVFEAHKDDEFLFEIPLSLITHIQNMSKFIKEDPWNCIFEVYKDNSNSKDELSISKAVDLIKEICV